MIIDWYWPVLLLPPIMRYSRRMIRYHCLRSHPDAIVQCHWIKQDIWRLKKHSGEQVVVRLLPRIFRSSALMILWFKPLQPHAHICLVIAPDAVTSQNYSALLFSTWAFR